MIAEHLRFFTLEYSLTNKDYPIYNDQEKSWRNYFDFFYLNFRGETGEGFYNGWSKMTSQSTSAVLQNGKRVNVSVPVMIRNCLPDHSSNYGKIALISQLQNGYNLQINGPKSLFIDFGTHSDIFILLLALIPSFMIAELINHCQSERISPLLCDTFVSSASFQQQTSSVDRRAYFQRNFPKIIYDFARYVHFCRYGGSQRLFRLFLEDPESSIVFAFEDFVAIPSREEFEQMIKRATEKPLNETGKEGQLRVEM